MLQQREMIPELMDDPGLETHAHDAALAGLRRLNAASGAAAAIAAPLHHIVRRRKISRVEILDVACGGGDVPAKVAALLKSAGVTVDLTLTDRSPTALAIAESAARNAGLDARILAGDAPANLPQGSWDFVTNSLFLHHLQRAEVVATLAQMAQRARVAVVISDLRRSRIGYLLAWLMCRILSRSPIVHHDGPVSVRAAWNLHELRTMAAEAGMTGAIVRASWPSRMLLIWEKR